MMQDNTPINFSIKHFFINCQSKELQPIFDTFVPLCIVAVISAESRFKLAYHSQSSIQREGTYIESSPI
jgi:hypothetical protein